MMFQTNPLELLFSLSNSLQQLDVDRFFKLITELEIVEINKSNLIERLNFDLTQEPKLLENINYWMLHKQEKYFTIVKIQDNSRAASTFSEQLLDSLINQHDFNVTELSLIMDNILAFFEHDPFLITWGISPDKSQFSLVYKDPLKQGKYISHSQESHLDQEGTYLSNIFCLIPTLVKTSGKVNPVNLCKIQNAINISNSISLKYIKYSDTKYLLSQFIQNSVLERITNKILSINKLLFWNEAEDLEILLQTLQESKNYNPEEQEFITQVDYFSNPSIGDRSDIIMNLLNGEKIQFFSKQKDDFQIDIFISYSSKYKEQTALVTFNGVQVLDENKRKSIQHFISQVYKKSFICVLAITTQNPIHMNMKECITFLDEHIDELKKPKFRFGNQVQVDKNLIAKGAKLMFSIEEKLKQSVYNLKPKQKEKVTNNLERLFVKFFLIDNI